jgi:lipid-binding SYLF domain-containing protein
MSHLLEMKKRLNAWMFSCQQRLHGRGFGFFDVGKGLTMLIFIIQSSANL